MAGDYTELYVDHGGSDLNGGSSAGVVDYALAAGAAGATATDNGADSNIEDLNNGSWAGVTVDMTLCFDTGGAKQVATVTAINVGADPDVITVSPQVTAAAQKGCNVGGAFLTINRSAAVNIGELAAATTTAYPPCVNIAADAAYTEDVELQITGTLACPFTWQGYKTVPRDYDTEGAAARAEVDGDGLSNYTGTWDGNAKSNIVLRDLYIHGDQAGIEAVHTGNGQYWLLHRVKATAAGASAQGIQSSGFAFALHNCWVTQAGGIGIYAGANNASIVGCRVDATGQSGLFVAGVCTVHGNVINDAGNAAGEYGIQVGGDNCSITNNVVYNSADSGIFFGDLVGESQGIVTNNILEECGQVAGVGYGIEIEAADKYLMWAGYNAYYNNQDGMSLNILEETGAINNTTGSFFVNAAGNDFRLNDTANQGALARDAAFPSTAEQPIWSS